MDRFNGPLGWGIAAEHPGAAIGRVLRLTVDQFHTQQGGKTMTRMFIHHSVADYAAWRKVYDAIDSERKPMGVTGSAVFRGADDGNDITVWHDFKTIDEAKAFAAWPRLKAAMDEAGVTSPPVIWFVNGPESGAQTHQ